MEKIQMVDLKSQYLTIKEEIDAALLQSVAEANYINGPQVKQFSENFKNFNHVKAAVTCANGTDALQIAMMALGFKPGDEVIVPAFTYIATVEVIALLGLIPKFIDVKEDTFEIDHEKIEALISDKTVGIIPVHLFGQCSNMEPILSVAQKYKLAIIEDAAQAVGAEYIFNNGKRAFAGTIGDIGTTSFFPSKNLGCFGDGGALMTQNFDLGEKMYMIANHGQQKKYQHDVIGVNSRLDTLQATILDVKLKYLDQYSAARQRVAKKYDNKLASIKGLIVPVKAPYSTHVYNQYTCRIKDGKRDDLKKHLENKGVPTMVYYPIPVHLQQAYKIYGYKEGDFPVAERLSKEVISLPIHTEMIDSVQDYIIEMIVSYFN